MKGVRDLEANPIWDIAFWTILASICIVFIIALVVSNIRYYRRIRVELKLIVDTLQYIMDKYFSGSISDKEIVHEIIKLHNKIKKAPSKECNNKLYSCK